MSNKPRMLINLPPPPSDPTTPSELGPGTPNSTTTSLSALSVVAIKDGAAGYNPHHSHHGHHGDPRSSSQTTLDAERADRISRLAGLERVSTVRPSHNHLDPRAAAAAAAAGSQQYGYNQQQGGGGSYAPAPYAKDISTVGSASATGSIGGKTQTTSGWAEQSMDYDDGDQEDKMSEDQDRDHDQDHDGDHDGDGVSSIGGFSDDVDKASLVGFGEGAGSTISGPVNTANARMIATRNIYNAANPGIAANNSLPRTQGGGGGGGGGGGFQSDGLTPMSGVERLTSQDAKMDSVMYDQGMGDAPPLFAGAGDQPPSAGGSFSGSGVDVAENVMRDRLDDRDPRTMATPPNPASLGKFGFERE